MTLENNEYTFAISAPEDWSDFDERRGYMQAILESRFTKPEAEAIMNIIESRWSDFAGKDAIVIEVEGYKCLTYITDEFTPIECADKVFPFDEKQIYPMQMAEMKICFKRYH